MPLLLTKSRERKNTYRLPNGEPLRRELRRYFREQRRAILAYIETGHVETKDQQARLPWGFPTWDEFRLGLLKMSERMTPLIEATWDRAASLFAPRIGLDPDEWSVVNPHTEAEIHKAALDFCQETLDTTSQQLDAALQKTRDELVEGIVKEGETVQQLTKRVNAVFDMAEKWRARRIAVTETSRAVHSAQEASAYASHGTVLGWRWLPSADACDVCLAIVARAPTVKLGEPFAVIGNNPTYSTIKFPPAHPNCRCTMVPVLDTEKEPVFHQTLNQPEAATEEETDEFYRREMDRINDIQRTWDPATGLYGQAPARAPIPKPPRRMPQPRLPFKPPPRKPRPTIEPPVEVAPAVPRAPGEIIPARDLPKFGPTKAEIKVDPYSVLDPKAKAKDIFKKPKTLRQLASLTGAIESAKVSIYADNDGISMDIVDDKYTSDRQITRDATGKLFMHANGFFIKPEHRGKGVGTEVFGRMVENAVKQGFEYIDLLAFRSSDANGYYTWPRFGYDGPLTESIKHRLPADLKGAKTIQDLFATPEGVAWWKINGESINLKFDLAKGSKSRAIWEAYLLANKSQ